MFKCNQYFEQGILNEYDIEDNTIDILKLFQINQLYPHKPNFDYENWKQITVHLYTNHLLRI